MTGTSQLDALRKNAFFRDIADEHLERLAAIATEIEWPSLQTVFEQYEHLEDIYVVVSGEVSLVICEPKYGCRQIAVVGDGDLLGWSPLLERSRLTASARTLKPTKALAFNGEKLLALCAEYPELGFVIMRRTAQVLSERLDATRMELFQKCGFNLPEVALESD